MARARRTQGGQAALELALSLPLLAVLLLVVVQAAVVVHDQVLVVHAARDAARAAAVDPSAEAPRRAAVASSALDPARLDVRVRTGSGPGEPVGVTVRYRSAAVAPMLGRLLPVVVVTGRASMRREF